MVSLGNPDSSFIIITDSETALTTSDELQFVADSFDTPHLETATN